MMTKEDVMKCSFSQWYSTFRNHTIKSEIIPLPLEFVEYLLSDGVILPESALAESQLVPSEVAGGTENGNDQNDTDWDTDGDEAPGNLSAPSFPDFEKNLKEVIQNLGGKVFPKLNWSSPRDAVWMSFENNLKCVCPGDIYLLLKSSDFVTHDLTQPFHQCDDYVDGDPLHIDYELVLRKWCTIQTGLEFRCFVQNDTLIAISQRDCTQHFDFLPVIKSEIVAGIKSFFYHVIQGQFPCNDFVFDVYRRDSNMFWVLDFNPFGSVTDPLMFTWEELEKLTDLSPMPVFRCIENGTGVQPQAYTTYTMPKDMADICSGEDPDKLIDWMSGAKIQSSSDISSSESELSETELEAEKENESTK